MKRSNLTRRNVLSGSASLLFAPSVVRAQSAADQLPQPQLGVRHNISSFSPQNWQDHFSDLGVGCLVADITSRALHYWGGDGNSYRLFPSSVPMTEELTRRGYSEIVRKKENPSWTPTVSMRARIPGLPTRIEGGDPDNPLGSRALYLTWPAYLVHGTHDTRKIGRRSSSGCIGLFNEHVEELYELVQVGTKIRLI